MSIAIPLALELLPSALADHGNPPSRRVASKSASRQTTQVFAKEHHDRVLHRGGASKKASHHLNSEFKMYRWDATADCYKLLGWQPIDEVSRLVVAGHKVLTGQETGINITPGAPVEIELRIAKNETQFKISGMPDT